MNREGHSLGPRAQAVYRSLRDRIERGTLPAGSKLPAQQAMAREMGVAVMTLRQALARLEAEGLIAGRHGRGTFVLKPADAIRAAEHRSAGEEGYRAFVESSPDYMFLLDPSGRILLASPRSGDLAQSGRVEDLIGCRLYDVMPPEDREEASRDTERMVRQVGLHRGEYRLLRADGTAVPVEMRCAAVADDDGHVHSIAVTASDLSEQSWVYEALRESEERYRAIAENASDGIVVVDETGQVLFANRAAADIFGYRDGELSGVHLSALMPAHLAAEHNAAFRRYLLTGQRRGHWPGVEVAGLHRDGRPLWLEVSLIDLSQQGRRVVGSFIRDVTDRKQAEEDLRFQALHDSLTGLPNRAVLWDRLEQHLAAARRDGSSVGLLIIDLDRFKQVNDTLGHRWGDVVLVRVAERLREVLRASDTVARLGGDEFAILLPDTPESGATHTADRILDALHRPWDIEGLPRAGGHSGDPSGGFDVGGSIGIALYPDHGHDPETLLQHADAAMYVAKRSQVGYSVFTTDADGGALDRLIDLSELQLAIAEGQFVLRYQPKLNLQTNLVERVEALIRWRHPTRGLLEPAAFLPLAERSGLIQPITRWVFREALAQCRLWHDMGLNLTLTVNLSAGGLRDEHLVDVIDRQLDLWRVEPDVLGVEVTEGALSQDRGASLSLLEHLRDRGILVALDNFGTHGSSLAHLRDLPADEIGIDRSFIKDISRDRTAMAVVRSVIDLAHQLGLRVVAEGAEDQPTVEMLSAMGCDLAQGFYLTAPLPPDRLADWLMAREMATA